MDQCDQCQKVFSRKDSLKRHKTNVHCVELPMKRKPNEGEEKFFQPLVKANAVQEEHECVQFKLKHPFCMLVAGPSHSGKTSWTVQLLAERRDRFQPPVDNILYCYSQWQKNYDDLKHLVPSTQFHQGQPSMEKLESLQNGILVLDDLMEESVNDSKIMNMFIVGSHHRNISVLFLMQNVYQKGHHTRTMSMNAQYMILFENPRDQTQIGILARQIFPSDWRRFLEYYKEETSAPYGNVILDLHPQTSNNDRIVKFHKHGKMVTDNAEAVENTEEMSVNHPSKQDTVVESKDDFQSKEQLVKLNTNTSHQVNMVESKDDFLTKQQHVLETIQQSILDLKQETMRSKIEGDVRARDFYIKQQHDLELVKQSLFDLKQETMKSKIEEDVAKEFQNKQQHDLELLKQSLFNLKQSATRESAHQVDMVNTNDENTQQSCLVRDGAKKKLTKYNKNADDEKLMQILRDHGYRTNEPRHEEPIDWTAPL